MMVPGALRLTLSHPFSPFSPFLNPPNPELLRFQISCRAADSSEAPPSPPPPPLVDPEGTGAAAPTRGALFLGRQQAKSAAALVLREDKRRRKKKGPDDAPKLSTAVVCCYGCGAALQTAEPDAPGYVDPETYELKKRHRQLRTVICGRCRLLSHGHMITAVGGNGGYPGGKQFVTAEELRDKLSHLRHEKALIVKLVDIVDFNGSFLARIRDLVGSNPIILVITKVDLLPKGTDLNCIGDWVAEATMKKKLNVTSIHLTSSKSLVGIAGVISEIQKEKKGAANVGKSAFINALLKMMAYKDPVAAAARKYKPMQSAVPGTTLGPIQIDAFQGGKMFDTPGMHLHHRQAAVVHSADLPLLAPQSRLRGQSFPVIPGNRTCNETESGLMGFSIFWGGLVRIDVLEVLPQTCLTFYGPRALKLHMVPTVEADAFYHNELGNLLTPPCGKERVEGWLGLQTERQLQIKYGDEKRPACDIAISGLGWIAVESFGKAIPIFEANNSRELAEELQFTVHVPKPVEVFVRPPIPVGRAGEEWYEYREITEKEDELRPKWYF
uniref:Nitric oxide synthase 1 n=1 Tax=Anthurium amnicola TaxID=1678845 RepID=A0A1D1YUS0_9ARAE